MLNNCDYNKIKILHELSSLLWFLEHHAQLDADKAGDKECHTLCKALAQDLEKYIAQCKAQLCK